jgi:hypothetical protein
MVSKFWSFYAGKQFIEHFLIAGITLFVICTLIILILILVSRLRKIKRGDLKNEYQSIIDNMLFAVTFDLKSPERIQTNNPQTPLMQNTLFQNLLLKDVVKLHQNYSGEYSKKIESFYFESGLINKSISKIKNNNWDTKCEGVAELSEMKVTAMYPEILKLTKVKNKTLKMVALVASINLKGFEAIETLRDYDEHIDDWIQINLFNAIKHWDLTDVPDFRYLLDSKNDTVVIFGLRLISMYEQAQANPILQKLITKGNSEDIRKLAAEIHQAFLLSRIISTGDL